MTNALRWTSADLDLLSENEKRYEIIDGELYVSKQPHWHHQKVCVRLAALLETWSMQTAAGEVNFAPGVIFAEDEDVAPDLESTEADNQAGIAGRPHLESVNDSLQIYSA
jgi:Uma2 family endonuclease